MTSHEISIDFGSARTKVAYLPEGRNAPELVELGMEVRHVVPSVFFIPKEGEGELAVGDDAVMMADQDPHGIVVDIKRDIHRSGKIRLGPGRLARTRQELVCDLLTYLHRRCSAEVFHQQPLTHCVLTVPVGFSEGQRDSLVQAALGAGFSGVRLVEEPVAAAQAWLTSPSGQRLGDLVIVVDVGGGTTDIAALRRLHYGFEPLPHLPHAGLQLGGNSIDSALAHKLCGHTGTMSGWLVKLRKVKELLPTSGRQELPVTLGNETILITREALDDASLQLVAGCKATVSKYLDDFRRVTGDSNCPILLAGGGSRLPGLKQELESLAPGRVMVWNESDFAIVKGALLGGRRRPVEMSDNPVALPNSQRKPALVVVATDSQSPALANSQENGVTAGDESIGLMDTLDALSQPPPEAAQCAACGRPIAPSQRALPPQDRFWTGRLGLARSGVCTKCYRIGVERGEEREWPFRFATVQAGLYWIGSPNNEINRKSDERQHSVRFARNYAIGTTPVTQAQYMIVAKTNPSHFKDPNRPVEQLTWFQAVAYCNELSLLRGLMPAYHIEGNSVTWIRESSGFRLPTEAEWEVACRAGTEGPTYGHLDAVAWYGANSQQKSHLVGKKAPNALGLYDTLGNVWEWCWDWYGEYEATELDPAGSTFGTYRVYRGGGWGNSGSVVRAASRFGSSPGVGFGSLGFRLCRTV